MEKLGERIVVKRWMLLGIGVFFGCWKVVWWKCFFFFLCYLN